MSPERLKRVCAERGNLVVRIVEKTATGSERKRWWRLTQKVRRHFAPQERAMIAQLEARVREVEEIAASLQRIVVEAGL